MADDDTLTDAEWEDLRLLALADRWENSDDDADRENALRLRDVVEARRQYRSRP